MRGAIAWFARNRVAANLMMIVIVGGGVFTLFNPARVIAWFAGDTGSLRNGLRQEVFPEFSLDLITVTVPYLGAAPEEVEEGVCVRIEEAIQDLDGVKRIRSNASEGVGTVTVEVARGGDPRKLLDDIKTRVDAIDTFPEETEQPVIEEVLNRRQVIHVAVSGNTDEKSLKLLGQQVRDEIAALPGITQVELTNARPYEISIEVSEEALRRHGLTFDEVVRAVRRSSIDLPGGSLRTGGGEILLRTKGQAYTGREFERLILLTRPDGTRLRVGDVATVVDGFAETDQSARFDGRPAVVVLVYRVGDQSALEVSRTVKRYVREAQARMPEGIALTTWQDITEVLRSRMNLLLRNALFGFLLVIAILALFLRFRLAFWVSIGIPISFLGAIWLMPGLDVSINLISLFAFIVVLGIVVDDAIVVGENIYTEQSRSGEGLAGAVRGAQEVSVPVVFAVLTSIVAFVPLLNVEGNTGKIMRVIPIIVISVLSFSLIESMFILPAHLSHLRTANRGRREGLWARFQGGFANWLDRFIRGGYGPLLNSALRWRYLTVAFSLCALLLTLGLVRGGWIKFVFFPDVEADYVAAILTMPQGTPVEVTERAVRHLEATALELRRELEGSGGPRIYRHVLASIGNQPLREVQGLNAGRTLVDFSGAHLGEVTIELVPSEERDRTSAEIVKLWRERAGSIPDAEELVFTSSLFSPGEPINVQLTGIDLDELRAAVDRLKRRLAEYPGVFDIADSFRLGKQEIKLRIKPAAEALGLTLADLARQVRQGFYGEEAQRIQRGRDDVRVMVRYPAAERRSLGDLENMRIRTPDGGEVPFSAVAVADLGRGFATIRRVDRRRAISVTAEVDTTKANANDILTDLQATELPAIRAESSGILYSFEGQGREQRETMSGLVRGFVIALLVIYTLVAVPFRSYVQPLIIMSAVPFGLVGAVWGHMIMGLNLTILSMFGIVALAGVVVNDNLVLVDFINRRRAAGATLGEAVRQAGAARFRAILLTSLTTFAGLTPLLLEKSVQARFLIPMAVSLAFGVLFATLISLLLVPCSYTILDDIRSVTRRGFGVEARRAAAAAAPGGKIAATDRFEWSGTGRSASGSGESN